MKRLKPQGKGMLKDQYDLTDHREYMLRKVYYSIEHELQAFLRVKDKQMYSDNV